MFHDDDITIFFLELRKKGPEKKKKQKGGDNPNLRCSKRVIIPTLVVPCFLLLPQING